MNKPRPTHKTKRELEITTDKNLLSNCLWAIFQLSYIVSIYELTGPGMLYFFMNIFLPLLHQKYLPINRCSSSSLRKTKGKHPPGRGRRDRGERKGSSQPRRKPEESLMIGHTLHKEILQTVYGWHEDEAQLRRREVFVYLYHLEANSHLSNMHIMLFLSV